MGPPVADGAFARWLAAAAGRLLLEVRDQMGYADHGALRDAGDKAAHDLIRTQLARWRPADAVLSEEDDDSRRAWSGPDGPARLRAERVWIVDPLDGTREFGDPGRDDWAVHVGLWSRQAAPPHRLAAGAVALPAGHRLFSTDRPPPYPPMTATAARGGRLRLTVSRSRPPAFVDALADEIGADLVPIGSAGAKVAAVISGDVDGYVHAGGQYEWDSAAPVAVAVAAGLHASRIDGSALEYNRPDPRVPDLLVCRRDLSSRLLAAIARHSPH